MLSILTFRSGGPMKSLSKRETISLTLSQGDVATYHFSLISSRLLIQTSETLASGMLYSFASGVFFMRNAVASHHWDQDLLV